MALKGYIVVERQKSVAARTFFFNPSAFFTNAQEVYRIHIGGESCLSSIYCATGKANHKTFRSYMYSLDISQEKPAHLELRAQVYLTPNRGLMFRATAHLEYFHQKTVRTMN